MRDLECECKGTGIVHFGGGVHICPEHPPVLRAQPRPAIHYCAGYISPEDAEKMVGG
jgi:hypothetical protein